eukprot:TRINITY_DN10692_c0_g2_i1.p1 TRINITY_DN10692_c0_g2~~TRINITY_DN10692_c0_g2_i1.p1  ORF type:complete len:577 (+),score=87.58 TRINITY_DN10692_c0_g2_i1:199-1929(+)
MDKRVARVFPYRPKGEMVIGDTDGKRTADKNNPEMGVREAFESMTGGNAYEVEGKSLVEVCEQFKLTPPWVVPERMNLDTFAAMLSPDVSSEDNGEKPEQSPGQRSASQYETAFDQNSLVSPLSTCRSSHRIRFLANKNPLNREKSIFNSSWPTRRPVGEPFSFSDDFQSPDSLHISLANDIDVERLALEQENSTPAIVQNGTADESITDTEPQPEEESDEEDISVRLGSNAACCSVLQQIKLLRRMSNKGVLSEASSQTAYDELRWKLEGSGLSPSSSAGTSRAFYGDVDTSSCNSSATISSFYKMQPLNPPLLAPFGDTDSDTTCDLCEQLEELLSHPVNKMVGKVIQELPSPVPGSFKQAVKKKKGGNNVNRPPRPIAVTEGVVNVRRAAARRAELVSKIRKAITKHRPGNAWLASACDPRRVPRSAMEYLQAEPLNGERREPRVKTQVPKVTPLVWCKPKRTASAPPKRTGLRSKIQKSKDTVHDSCKAPSPLTSVRPPSAPQFAALHNPMPLPNSFSTTSGSTTRQEAAFCANYQNDCEEWEATSPEIRNDLRHMLQLGPVGMAVPRRRKL